MSKDLKKKTDNQLLKGCSRGDMRCYDELFFRYSKKLYVFGMRFLHDHFLVEEFALDILYSIWERRADLALRNDLSSYLFQAMRNKAIDYYRKRRIAFVDDDYSTIEVLSDDYSADYKIQSEEADQQIKTVLAKLSPQRRRVFELSRLHGLSNKAISKQMDISINTVESHMTAALSSFRKYYSELSGILLLCLQFFFL